MKNPVSNLKKNEFSNCNEPIKGISPDPSPLNPTPTVNPEYEFNPVPIEID